MSTVPVQGTLDSSTSEDQQLDHQQQPQQPQQHQQDPALTPTPSAALQQQEQQPSSYPISNDTAEDIALPETHVVFRPKDSQTLKLVKARIDSNVPLDEVIRQLCSSIQLGVKEPPALFCLRDLKTDELVTPENFHRKVGTDLKLVSSPLIEAVEICDKLGQHDDAAAVKKATFQLRSFAKESEFVSEFLARGGLRDLLKVIQSSKSNTLAYALASLESLTENEECWRSLDENAIRMIFKLMLTQNLANICRPATAITRRYITAPAPTSTSSSSASSSESGFEFIWKLVKEHESEFFDTVCQRLAGGEYLLIQSTLGLIITLMNNVTEAYYEELANSMEASDISKNVIAMIDNNRGADLGSLIIQYQSHIISINHRQKQTTVDFRTRTSHENMLNAIIKSANLNTSFEDACSILGFSSSVPNSDFDKVGLLGLKAMKWFSDTQDFPKMIFEITSRQSDRQCPFVQACNETTEILSDVFEFNSGIASSTSLQPFMLAFPRVHRLVLKFFVRIWTESGATRSDFARVPSLVRSCVQSALLNEDSRTWAEVEREFQETEYGLARDRQIKELAIEDDLRLKAPIRKLRNRIVQESYEFMRSQRIHCLQQGAWFQQPATKQDPNRKVIPRTWRFYRLAANRKHLHYSSECSQKINIRGGLDDLPDKIDLSTVTDIIPANKNEQRDMNKRTKGGILATSPSQRSGGSGNAGTYGSFSSGYSNSSYTTNYSFSLYNAQGLITEMIATDQALYSEWLDGLSLLRPDGYVSTQGTTDIIHALTEIQIKLNLLDLSGDRIDLPSHIPVGLPPGEDFYYADEYS